MLLPQGNTILGEANSGWNSLKLFRSGCQVSKGREHPKPSGMRSLKNVVPYVGTKAALFQFLHIGVTLPWMTYQVDLMFSDVEYTHDANQSNEQDWVQIKYRDLSVYMRKIDLNKNRVRVRCACPDFYFTFAWQDFQQGALFGSKPKRYVRKTIWNPTAPVGHRGYPPRNPNNYAGMCKHCANSIQLAQQNGWILPQTHLF